MTITEAQEEIRVRGTLFSVVFAQVEEHNQEELKLWFVKAAGVPNLRARHTRQPLPSGNLCRCGGMMVRTGSCETCQCCGNSSGGCG